MTKAEKKHVERVVRLGCCVCRNNGLDTQDSPAEFHHIKTGITGVALRSSTWQGLALCPIHHRQGDGTAAFEFEVGYHVSPEEWELRYGTQGDLLKQQCRELGLNPNDAKFLPRMLAESLIEEAA